MITSTQLIAVLIVAAAVGVLTSCRSSPESVEATELIILENQK